MGNQPGSRDTVGSHPPPPPAQEIPAQDVPVPPEELRRRQLGRMLINARAGDRRALDEIVDRLMPLVWNVARAQGLDQELAADVVQSSWVTLLEHLADIRSPEALASWLITVTRREARGKAVADVARDLMSAPCPARCPVRPSTSDRCGVPRWWSWSWPFRPWWPA